MQNIILFKVIILSSMFHLFNSDMSMKIFDTAEILSYDEDKHIGTEGYISPTVNHNVVVKTTGFEEIVTDENDLNVVCPHFKKSGEINLERMVGVWRPIYYQVSHKVPCFKMLIRKVTAKEQIRYSQLYGDFKEKVIWDDCNLEIKSSANLVHRKHFLQGCEKGFGVLENIIIEQKGDEVPNLLEENADQWLAIKDLLLMRDCNSGDIVIFSTENYQPKLNDVSEAMINFGNVTNGEWACNDAIKIGSPQAFDGEFESDSDLVFFE